MASIVQLLMTMMMVSAMTVHASADVRVQLTREWGDCPDPGRMRGYSCSTLRVPVCYTGVCNATNATLDLLVARARDIAAPVSAMVAISMTKHIYDTIDVIESKFPAPMTEIEATQTLVIQFRGWSSSLDTQLCQNGTRRVGDARPCLTKFLRPFGSDGAAAFSLSSVAMDIASFVQLIHNNNSIIGGNKTTPIQVYAYQMGTAVARRLMQIQHIQPLVSGYFLDNMVHAVVSDRDTAFARVADEMLVEWDARTDVHEHFDGKHVRDELVNLMSQLDDQVFTTSESLCGRMVHQHINSEHGNDRSVSVALRLFLSKLLLRSELRPLIPALIYRLRRCLADDVTILHRFLLKSSVRSLWGPEDEQHWIIPVIQMSEMWESPAPTATVLKQRVANASICPSMVFELATEFEGGKWPSYPRDVDPSALITLPINTPVVVCSEKRSLYYPDKVAAEFLGQLRGGRRFWFQSNATLNSVVSQQPKEVSNSFSFDGITTSFHPALLLWSKFRSGVPICNTSITCTPCSSDVLSSQDTQDSSTICITNDDTPPDDAVIPLKNLAIIWFGVGDPYDGTVGNFRHVAIIVVVVYATVAIAVIVCGHAIAGYRYLQHQARRERPTDLDPTFNAKKMVTSVRNFSTLWSFSQTDPTKSSSC